MTKENTASLVGTADKHDKGRWSTPMLTRIDAGDAEVGTRATSDGSFTFS